jgi:hypothetical protein
MANKLKTGLSSSSHAASQVDLRVHFLDYGLRNYTLLCRTCSLTIDEMAAVSFDGTASVSIRWNDDLNAKHQSCPSRRERQDYKIETFPFGHGVFVSKSILHLHTRRLRLFWCVTIPTPFLHRMWK